MAGPGPADRVLALDLADEGQRALHTALDGARAAARERLSAIFGAFDLAAWVADGRDRQPCVGRAGDGLAALGLAGAVDRHLAAGPVVRAGDDARRTLLTWARDGIDEDLVPDAPDVRHDPHEPGARWADPSAMAAHLRAGGTYKVRGLERTDLGAWALVADVERVAGTSAGVLVYLSGPGAEGWGGHYDRHDGIVLQVAGHKRWRVLEPVVPRPLRPWSPYRIGDRVALDVVLAPGDLLVVPRGWGHVVTGEHDVSCHLTVPISRPAAAAVLELAAELAGRREGLRADLGADEEISDDLLRSAYCHDLIAEHVLRRRSAVPLRPPPGSWSGAALAQGIRRRDVDDHQVAATVTAGIARIDHGPRSPDELIAGGVVWPADPVTTDLLGDLVADGGRLVVELADDHARRARLADLAGMGLVASLGVRPGTPPTPDRTPSALSSLLAAP